MDDVDAGTGGRSTVCGMAWCAGGGGPLPRKLPAFGGGCIGLGTGSDAAVFSGDMRNDDPAYASLVVPKEG